MAVVPPMLGAAPKTPSRTVGKGKPHTTGALLAEDRGPDRFDVIVLAAGHGGHERGDHGR